MNVIVVFDGKPCLPHFDEIFSLKKDYNTFKNGPIKIIIIIINFI